MNRGVMMTPALYVDGESKMMGRTATVEEIKKMLKKLGRIHGREEKVSVRLLGCARCGLFRSFKCGADRKSGSIRALVPPEIIAHKVGFRDESGLSKRAKRDKQLRETAIMMKAR
jgi:hypothetical protein